MEKNSAEEMLNLIEELEGETKQQVLDKIYDEYYAGGGATRHNVQGAKQDKKIENLEKDVEYLSGKLINLERILNRLTEKDEDLKK